MWCIAELDAAYIACMEEVLALYERPFSKREPVVCLDEQPVSLHAEVRPARAARPGHVAKRDNEYRRCGTANIFGVVEPKTGRHFTCATKNRTGAAFARMVRTVVRAYPRARTIHLVMDNRNTHREKALTDHYGVREGKRLWRCLTVHYTPVHGSWLNQAEIELSLVSRLETLPTLQRHTRAWSVRATRRRTTIDWQFSRRDARRKFGYVKPRSKRSKN